MKSPRAMALCVSDFEPEVISGFLYSGIFRRNYKKKKIHICIVLVLFSLMYAFSTVASTIRWLRPRNVLKADGPIKT